MKILKTLLYLLIAFGTSYYFFGGGLDASVEAELQKIENQVANDAIIQYEIAVRNGSDMDAYVQAGIVAAAFLQANNEENYKKWKAIENQMSKKLGLQ